MALAIGILGQGLAGTLLAWELEAAGVPFTIVDRGLAGSASQVAAGIVNPIAGRRLVKSWRVDTALPVARAAFRRVEAALGMPLWRDLRIRRFFADAAERRIFSERHARNELSPFLGPDDDAGFWVEGAGCVDVPALLAASRTRWRERGCLREQPADLERERELFDLVIDCRGTETAAEKSFAFVPWEFSKGEILELSVSGLAADVVLNRRRWILPRGSDRALVGATHQPGATDATPSPEARRALEHDAAALLGRPVEITNHFAGVRVNLPDKRPVAGRHPRDAGVGVFNGLGAKGALWAPMLAMQWVAHLARDAAFDAEVDVARYAGK